MSRRYNTEMKKQRWLSGMYNIHDVCNSGPLARLVGRTVRVKARGTVFYDDCGPNIGQEGIVTELRRTPDRGPMFNVRFPCGNGYMYCYMPLRKLRLAVRTCRVCGCTDLDCSGCIDRTGHPCHWVAQDLCSACKA